MGRIKLNTEYEFRCGLVTLFWDEGEKEECGYEIQLELRKTNGQYEGLGGWSFGYEDWSQEIWKKWGEYIEKRLKEIDGCQQSLDAFIDELGDVDCCYKLYNEDYQKDDFIEHLKDIEIILQLVN
ncbi:hypothetical protein [Priestia flexa]|uniref:hypothetical protein n=1 Tax=Priestia flexa TaxID=86664 RepID=UPI00077C1E52|nr:hypothetical protein [Priestia flexa]MED4587668.1 hypothetical protein [Priestia flexa]